MITIPDWAIRPLVYLALAVALVAGGWVFGARHVYNAWLEERGRAAAAAVKIVTRQGEVTERVITRYRDRIQEVKGETEHIIHDVPVYIPVAADRRLPLGWRLLHDAAAVGAVPAAAAGIDVTRPDVDASAALRGVVDNYGTCRATAEQLNALQAWVRGQFETTNGEALGY